MGVDLEGRKISAVIWRWRRRGAAVGGDGGAVAYRWMPVRRRVRNILHDQPGVDAVMGFAHTERLRVGGGRERGESTDSLITMP